MSGNPSTSNRNAAMNTLMLGLNVTSTATPALSGTYDAAGPVTEPALQDQTNALLLDSTFADGTTSLSWPDSGGTAHTFDVAQFKSLLAALTKFRAQCRQYAWGLTTTPPSSAATIP